MGLNTSGSQNTNLEILEEQIPSVLKQVSLAQQVTSFSCVNLEHLTLTRLAKTQENSSIQ
jgi:hypothetical protein